MKILYDATPLLMRSAGVKNYHYELLKRLFDLETAHRLRLFPFLNGLPPNDNERSNYSRWSTVRGLGGLLAANYLKAPFQAVAARGADLFHVTHHLFDPPRGPLLTSMVHDPTPLLMPTCHTQSNIRYFERFVERTLPRLAAVITPSEAVKQDLIAHCGADLEKVRAIHHGVDPVFFDATEAEKREARRTYDLPERFILAVGSVEPRKNLIRLIEAYGGLGAAARERTALVLAGPSGWHDDDIRRRIEQAGNVRSIGYVRRDLLPAVYHLANIFAFPSLYEGFGMPLLEAMAAGTPIVSSNRSAMPEVVGEAGLLVNPEDVDAIRGGLERVINDEELAAKFARSGRERALSFTWEKTAAETLGFLEECAGS